MAQRIEKPRFPQPSAERYRLDEEQAHRLLQRKSMDSGSKLSDTARRILERPGGPLHP